MANTLSYENLIKEYLSQVDDRDYCRFLWMEKSPLYLAWLCAGERKWIIRTSPALSDLKSSLLKHIDFEEDPEKRRARNALVVWVAQFEHLINPYFTTQEIWGGNGEYDTWGFEGIPEWRLEGLRGAPEPLRSELLRRADEANRWWVESREERRNEPVWTPEDDEE